MQLLFSSTSLILHSESFSNSFSDNGITFYSLSETELKEYLSNFPDLHLNGVCYRLLNPEYYIWIRKQVCKVVNLYKIKKLTLEQIEETRDNWKVIHQYAVDNFKDSTIKNTIDDIKLQTELGLYNYRLPIYNPTLETTLLKSNPRAKQPNSYTQSKRICPNCSSFLSEKVFRIGATHYQCFACNDYSVSEPTSTINDEKYIDKFANTKPYCTIEYTTDIGNKCCTDTAFNSIGQSDSSPKDTSFLRNSDSSSLDGEKGNTLSDLSNLSWLEILLILDHCQKDTELRKDNFALYLQVIALSGYRHAIHAEKPNIGREIGLIGFLDSARKIVSQLVEQGYCQDIAQNAQA